MTRPCVSSTPAASPRAFSTHPTRSMPSSGRACSATRGCANWWPNISMPTSSRRSQPNTPRGGGCSSSRPIWIRSAPRSGTWDGSPRSRTPEALNLFRDVVAASASLPVVFPPMLVTAEANGKRFEEMHVDGGVTAPVLTLPEAYLLHDAKPGKLDNLQLYILINNKVEREFQAGSQCHCRNRGAVVIDDDENPDPLDPVQHLYLRPPQQVRIQPDLHRGRSAGFTDLRLRHRLYARAVPVRLRQGARQPSLVGSPPPDELEPAPMSGVSTTRHLASGN